MRKLISAFCLTAVLASGMVAQAASAAPADPSGKWTWTASAMGRSTEVTATLSYKDGQLTGTIGSSAKRAGKTEIKNGTLADDGTISFDVERTTKRGTVTTSYQGKLEGDTITGTIKLTGPKGKTTSTDWKAARSP